MSGVRLALWAVVLTLFAVFSATNWTSVPVAFGTTELLVKLPVLLLATAVVFYLLGSLRTRIRHRRRATAVAPPPAVTPLPAEAQPTIVPPGCG